MKARVQPPFRLRQRGIMLVEVVVYTAVLFVILGLAVGAFLRVLDHARAMRRVVDDTTRAVAAGERWREDIRAASGPPRLVSEGTGQTLHLPTATGETVYRFESGQVLRASDTNATEIRVLDRVKATTFHADAGLRSISWRWELELEASRKDPRLRPLFTFQAVPTAKGARP